MDGENKKKRGGTLEPTFPQCQAEVSIFSITLIMKVANHLGTGILYQKPRLVQDFHVYCKMGMLGLFGSYHVMRSN